MRWESAEPVYQARKTQLPPEAKDHYIITVSGLPMMGGGMGGPGGMQRRGEGKQGGGPDVDPEARRKMMQDRLAESTRIERKGKDPIHPDNLMLGQNQPIIIFYFPHTSQPIVIADKEVTFITRMGPMEVKVKFPLKEMVYKGKLSA